MVYDMKERRKRSRRIKKIKKRMSSLRAEVCWDSNSSGCNGFGLGSAGRGGSISPRAFQWSVYSYGSIKAQWLSIQPNQNRDQYEPTKSKQSAS